MTQRPLFEKTQYFQETDVDDPAGFEPTEPAGERPPTHALDRAATEIGKTYQLPVVNLVIMSCLY